ncbi:MAG: L-threonylcarbamoyladenylate synthase [Bacteroidota bacterium]|nr:L-threonylcarbamoyladenylate synthase [Bacteroidota bacterium]
MIDIVAEIMDIDKNFDLAVTSAKKLFFNGKIFIYPTDTIYGFGCNPFNEDAVANILKLKGRDEAKRFILLIDSIDSLLKYIDVKIESHIDFLISIWPNPITVVLNLNKNAKKIFKHETAAFRIPSHRFCLKLLSEIKMPLISTSVNRTGRPSLNDIQSIKYEYSSQVDAVFYTQKPPVAESSTLIDLSKDYPILLREGKYKFEDIMKKYEEV